MKYSEADLLIPALEIVFRFPGINTTELINRLEKTLTLSDEDLDTYDSRNDSVFSQTVRNLCGSHIHSNEFGRCVSYERIDGNYHFWINEKGLLKIK